MREPAEHLAKHLGAAGKAVFAELALGNFTAEFGGRNVKGRVVAFIHRLKHAGRRGTRNRARFAGLRLRFRDGRERADRPIVFHDPEDVLGVIYQVFLAVEEITKAGLSLRLGGWDGRLGQARIDCL
jgi:hypothetical protein